MNKIIEKVLKEQEKLNEEKKHSTIDRETGKIIHNLIESKNPKNVLEVGTSIGYSGIWIASAIKKGKLTTIDRWKERQDIAEDFFKKAKLNTKIKAFYGNALEIIPALKTKFDVVFLDATKSEYMKYTELLIKNKKLNKNALIIADNTISHPRVHKMKDFLNFAEKHNAKTIKTKAGLTIFTV